MDDKWLYYGFFLDEVSRKKLIEGVSQLVRIPEDWRVIAEHCTIVFNNGSKYAIDAGEVCNKHLGEKVIISTESVGFSGEVIAVRVYAKSLNVNPHITIAIAPGSKPVKSNEIKNFGLYKIHMDVETTLKVVKKM